MLDMVSLVLIWTGYCRQRYFTNNSNATYLLCTSIIVTGDLNAHIKYSTSLHKIAQKRVNLAATCLIPACTWLYMKLPSALRTQSWRSASVVKRLCMSICYTCGWVACSGCVVEHLTCSSGRRRHGREQSGVRSRGRRQHASRRQVTARVWDHVRL